MMVSESYWLWAIAALPILGWALYELVSRKERRIAAIINRKVWPKVFAEYDPGLRRRKIIVWLLATLFIIFALSGPKWDREEETVATVGADVVVALDVSRSMLAEDVVPSRLRKGKHIVTSFLDGLKGDRVGVLAFGATATLSVPLTTDLDYVRESLETIDEDSVAIQGTDIGIALETANAALTRGAEEMTAENPEVSEVSNAVILISDGEEFENRAVEAAQKLKEQGVALFVIGVGTEEGAKIPVRDDRGVLRGYKKGPGGDSVVTRFRSDALREVAEAAGGTYFQASTLEGEVQQILKAIGALDRTNFQERRVYRLKDRYQWPLIVGILLLLYELSIPARRLGGVAVVLLALLGTSVPLRAADLSTIRENEEALEALSKGDLTRARRLLGNAQARRPDDPALLYNQGVLEAQSKRPTEAARTFQRAAELSMRAGQEGMAARSLYNEGAALEKSGDLNKAAAAYLSALKLAERNQDTEEQKLLQKKLQDLVREEQKNPQAKRKQGQGQPQDQQKKGGESEQTAQGQKQDDSKEGQQKQDQKQQNAKNGSQSEDKQYRQPNPDFKSEKLSKQDATNVMQDLADREKELKKRLSRRNQNLNRRGRARQERINDW